MANPPAYPGTPRWVKVSAAVAAILLLAVLIVVLASGGRHGPGRHLPGNGDDVEDSNGNDPVPSDARR